MSNYILTLQVETFYSLYRFGKIAIDKSGLIPVLGQTKDGRPKVDESQFIEKFPQFVDDDFYVILECALDPAVPTDLNFSGTATLQDLFVSITKVSDNSPQTILKIDDVINIFPLTDRASIILKGRLKEEINLGKPVFQDLINKAQHESDKLEISSGALALLNLCGLEDMEKSEKLDSVIFDAVKLRKEGGEMPDTASLLFRSIVYDRHEPFPTSDLGLLYDLNKIMSDIFKFDHTAVNFYKYLEKLQQENNYSSLPELIKLFEGAEECKNIRVRIIEKSDSEKDYVSILLFLKYRDELRRLGKKKGKLAKMRLLDDLAELKSDYSHESRNGLYLLGGFFSYEYFIDDYYAHRKLRILRTSVEIQDEKPEKVVIVRQKRETVAEKESRVEEAQKVSAEDVKHKKTIGSSNLVENLRKNAQVEYEKALETDEGLSQEEHAESFNVGDEEKRSVSEEAITEDKKKFEAAEDEPESKEPIIKVQASGKKESTDTLATSKSKPKKSRRKTKKETKEENPTLLLFGEK